MTVSAANAVAERFENALVGDFRSAEYRAVAGLERAVPQCRLLVSGWLLSVVVVAPTVQSVGAVLGRFCLGLHFRHLEVCLLEVRTKETRRE